MQKSADRILTTHVGSLPRSKDLSSLLLEKDSGKAVDTGQLDALIHAGTIDSVKKQVAAGIDICNDGEHPRIGFSTQCTQRMTGFGSRSSNRRRATDFTRFPGFAEHWNWMFRGIGGLAYVQPRAISDIHYHDIDPVKAECSRLLEAQRSSGAGDREAFFTSPSPGLIATTMENAHYDSHERYVFALAHEMRKEYEAIVASGLILQVDAPDLAMERSMTFQDLSDSQFIDVLNIHVAALNEALSGIPRDRVRLHVCWGASERPHIDDVELRKVLPTILKARIGGLSIPFANARHLHEYSVFRDIPLPDHMVLIPGVIDNTTNIVEHPRVVANRIQEAVAAVGDRTRVIAGTDCGFATFVGFDWVAPDVVYAKLASCRHGADIASAELWGGH